MLGHELHCVWDARGIPEERARKAAITCCEDARGNMPIIAAGFAHKQSVVSVAGEDGKRRNRPCAHGAHWNLCDAWNAVSGVVPTLPAVNFQGHRYRVTVGCKPSIRAVVHFSSLSFRSLSWLSSAAIRVRSAAPDVIECNSAPETTPTKYISTSIPIRLIISTPIRDIGTEQSTTLRSLRSGYGSIGGAVYRQSIGKNSQFAKNQRIAKTMH